MNARTEALKRRIERLEQAQQGAGGPVVVEAGCDVGEDALDRFMEATFGDRQPTLTVVLKFFSEPFMAPRLVRHEGTVH